MNSKIFIITFALTCILSNGCISFETKYEDDKNRRKFFSIEVIDSLNIGLKRFYEKQKRFPITDSKYFFDSLQRYVQIDPVYLYCDSITSKGDTILMLRESGRIKNPSRFIFIGIGSTIYNIQYICNDGQHYRLILDNIEK